MNLDVSGPRSGHVMPADFRKRLADAVRESWYGREVVTGFCAYAAKGGTVQKIKNYALAVFGTLFAGAATYFSFDGSVRMIQWSLDEEKNGNPLPSDIGHGGEWLQQPFQYALAGHMYLWSAFSNQGQLEEVKSLYANLIKELEKTNEEKDISSLYQQFEEDFRFLSRRSFLKLSPLQIRLVLTRFFERVDTRRFSCPALDQDRALKEDYTNVLKQLEQLNSWKIRATCENWKHGFSRIKSSGAAQTVQSGVGVTAFQLGMLVSSVFLMWGLKIVIDEVFISRSGPEASGHLSEWSTNLFTNVLLMYLAYSWVIKREALFQRTRNVMRSHLEGYMGEEPSNASEVRKRLIETFNACLDELANSCRFTTLPSLYRFDPDNEDLGTGSLPV